jgi:hypothetical protein
MKIIITEDQFEKLKDDGGLDYIDTQWKKYKGIGYNIRKNLPDVTTGNEKEVGKHLRVKPYSELESNWSIKDLRWNWKAYTLNDREIKKLKEFFNL